MRHEKAKEHKQAIADYTQILKLKPDWPEVLFRRGIEHFKLAQIPESLADWDRAIALKPDDAPQYWQRGIALYYAGRYEDGAKQFELHQTVNGNDVENAAWRYLCMARTQGVPAAKAALLPIEGDTRIPMMEVYALFRGATTVDKVLAAAARGGEEGVFMANLYVGLYYEAESNRKLARKHIQEAVDRMVDHYMHDVAVIHLKLMKR